MRSKFNIVIAVVVIVMSNVVVYAVSPWDLPAAGRISNVDYPWQSSTPYSDHDGAKWHCMDQMLDNPTLTSVYSNMYFQTALYGWVGHRVFDAYPGTQYDPYPRLHGFALRTTSPGTRPGAGPAAIVAFEAAQKMAYNYDIQGVASLQTESAGYVKVQIYSLNTNKTSGTLLQSFDLNEAGGYGSYPSNFVATGSVTLDVNEYIAVSVQSIAPGTGNPGVAAITFSKFNMAPPAGTVVMIK